MHKQIILIPALDPDHKLITLENELLSLGVPAGNMIIVDDGSSEEAQPVFAKLEEDGAVVLHHPENRGKGAALKTGIQAAAGLFGPSCTVVTADADGQHKAEDILRIAETSAAHPASLILGTRTFDGADVPARSQWGNAVTALIFRMRTGVSCRDTQTGLRAIPGSLFPLALSTEGTRYEYEMQFLTDAVRQTQLIQIPIRTVYEDGNCRSHYRPVRDSLRIFAGPLRFLAASLAGAAVDYTLFIALGVLLAGFLRKASAAILAASILARLVSGLVNFLLNKHWSFRSTGNTGSETVRYAVLFFAQMQISAFGTMGLASLLPAAAAKIIIDCSLFVISYYIQKKWVFQKGTNHHEQKNRQFFKKTPRRRSGFRYYSDRL